LPAACRTDDNGRPRVVAQPLGFAEVLGLAFDSLRPYACSNAVVVARMLHVLELVAADARRAGDRAALADHARSLERRSREQLGQGRDHARVLRRFESVMHAIETAA
jgi:uncharacterized membrane protein